MRSVATSVDTIRVGRRTYRIETVAESEVHVSHARFILHDPRGRKYLLVPDAHRLDRLVAIAPVTHFARFRPTPLGDTRFVVQADGKLVVAALDA